MGERYCRAEPSPLVTLRRSRPRPVLVCRQLACLKKLSLVASQIINVCLDWCLVSRVAVCPIRRGGVLAGRVRGVPVVD